jgi:hypothetical protein
MGSTSGSTILRKSSSAGTSATGCQVRRSLELSRIMLRSPLPEACICKELAAAGEGDAGVTECGGSEARILESALRLRQPSCFAQMFRGEIGDTQTEFPRSLYLDGVPPAAEARLF